jgi:chaperonin cofactor prefoldin
VQCAAPGFNRDETTGGPLSSTINPEMRDLQQKYEDLRASLAKTQGEVEEIRRQTANNTRQTIWQFVIFTITMGGIMIGAMNYQTNVLRNEFNSRFEAINARLDAIDSRMDNMEKRLDRVERNLDELNRELRSRKR